jgi:hypothetical protein
METISNSVSINSEYDVTFNDGSLGHAYSISINSEQLGNIQPILPSLNREFEAVLVTTQKQGVTYIIAYVTDYGKMNEFESTFQNILASVNFS